MKIKRILSFIIALAIIITSVPVLGTTKKASASNNTIVATTEDGVEYTFEGIIDNDEAYAVNVHITGGTITLNNGTYTMPNEITKGKISYIVRSVCGDADGSDFFGTADFTNDETLEHIVLPDTLEEIGVNAFIDYSSLTSVTLGKNVKKLSATAFYSKSRPVDFELTIENPNLIIEDTDVHVTNEKTTLGSKWSVKGYTYSTANDVFGNSGRFVALNGTSYKIGFPPLSDVTVGGIRVDNTYKYADDVNSGLFINYLYYVKGVTTDVKFTMPEIAGDKVVSSYDGYYNASNAKIVDIDGNIVASNLPSSSANISVSPIATYKTFNITYHMADDTTVNSTYTYSTGKTDLKQTDTKLGYTFKGWSTKKGDADSLVTVGTMLNESMAEDLDLYPIFEANEYKVSFGLGEKTSVYDYTFKYNEYDNAKLQDAWNKASKSFIGLAISGWKYNDTIFSKVGELSQNFIAENAVNGVLRLEGLSSDISYTITFIAGEGHRFKTAPKSMTYKYKANTTTELPTVEEATGEYDFNGWYCKDVAEGNIGTTWHNDWLAKNVVLTALWKRHESGVTFDANGGTFKDNTDLRVVSIPVGEKISVNYVPSPAPTKEYCTFLGYSTDKNAKIPDKEIVAKDDLTVYAVWQKKTITYRFSIFNSDLNTNYGSIAFKKGDKVVSASNPEEILIEQTVGEKIITPFDKESGWTYTDNGFPSVIPYGYEIRIGASMTTYTTTAVKNAIVEDYTGNEPKVYVSVTWKTNAHKITLDAGEGAFGNGTKKLTIDAVVGTPLKDIIYGGEHDGINIQTQGLKSAYVPERQGYTFAGWKNEANGGFITPYGYFIADADCTWTAMYTKQTNENKSEDSFTFVEIDAESSGLVYDEMGVPTYKSLRAELDKNAVDVSKVAWLKQPKSEVHYDSVVSTIKTQKEKDAFTAFYNLLKDYYIGQNTCETLEFCAVSGDALYQADANVLEDAYFAFMYDHPEASWVEYMWGGSMGTTMDGRDIEYFIVISASGYSTKSTVSNAESVLSDKDNKYKALINKVNAYIKKDTSNAPNDYKTVLAISKVVSKYIVYPKLNQTATGFYTDEYRDPAFAIYEDANNYGVCVTYAKLTHILCNYFGIECTDVTGIAGEGHQWNLVKIGGKWYNLDTTWLEKTPVNEIADSDYFLFGTDLCKNENRTYESQSFVHNVNISKTDYQLPKTLTSATMTKGGVTYKVSGSGAIVVKATKNSGKVTISDTISIGGRNYKVTKINNNVFKGKKITSVTVGKNVKSIGSGAFMNCKKLKTVTIKSKSVKFGKNCFKGIYAKATIKTASKAQAKKVKKASVGYKKTMKVK